MWEPPGVVVNNNTRVRDCFVEDAGILRAMVQENVPANSVVLIMNGDKSDVSFTKLPTLCKMYRCVRKEMLWSATTEAHIDLVQTLNCYAMIDSELALHSTHFFGNLYSTMSLDVYYSLIAAGRKATMYNPHII